jgi:hypothetical protein
MINCSVRFLVNKFNFTIFESTGTFPWYIHLKMLLFKMNVDQNPSKILTIAIFFGVLFFLVIGTEGYAQSDIERTFKEEVNHVDNSYADVEKQDVRGLVNGKKSSKSGTSLEPANRDSSGYRLEDQKESKEDGKSTLSFNIFLYVLDRFKEN